jgi:hypothetical protein
MDGSTRQARGKGQLPGEIVPSNSLGHSQAHDDAYAAEREAWGADMRAPSSEHGRMRAWDTEFYLREVMRQPWFSEAYPGNDADDLTVTCEGSAPYRPYSSVSEYRINLIPDHAWVGPPEWWSLHELAHLVRGAARGEISGHDQAWRDIYVFLVRNRLGDDAANKLASAFSRRPLI